MYINEVTQKNAISSTLEHKKDEKKRVNFNNFLSIAPDSSFLMRVKGDSMINAGISSGDMIIADKAIKPKSGDIVIAELNGRLTIKRYFDNGKKLLLKPENEKYQSIQLTGNDNIYIWGVVTQNIKSV